MATSGKCEQCGAEVLSDQRKCPACGAPNENYVEHKRQLHDVPRTVDDLKAYCASRGMPLERMRFFIGEDCREPCAFGICRQGEEFVTYKNRTDGTRFERYRGPDEAVAVEELFVKLLDECHMRRIYPENMKG